MKTISLTLKEIETAGDRIYLTIKEIAKKRGVSPDAIKQRSDRILYKTHSFRIQEAIHKLTKAGVLVLAITTAIPATYDNRLNNRRRAQTSPVISYRLDSVASAPA
jgi:SOS-response transcriptional repressor LexA